MSTYVPNSPEQQAKALSWVNPRVPVVIGGMANVSYEAYTIGTGSYDGAAPTENGIRAEVGLPRRDNHYGSTTDAYGNELTAPPVSLRPGDC